MVDLARFVREFRLGRVRTAQQQLGTGRTSPMGSVRDLACSNHILGARVGGISQVRCLKWNRQGVATYQFSIRYRRRIRNL
jgi:hypothetical protein